MAGAGTNDAEGAAAPPRVLVISGMYPAAGDPTFGAFIAKQDEALGRLRVPHRVVANTDPRPGSLHGLLKYTSLLARTLGAASRRDFDVVVGHFLYPSAWLARLAARIGRTPYVVVAHGTDVTSVRRGGPLAAACLRATRAANRVIAVSHDLERRARKELALPEETGSVVIDMGVDRAVFRPREGARRDLGWDADERIALFAGNLIARKAPDVLLEAFAVLASIGACDRLVIVGDGEMRMRLAGKAAELGVAEAVTFTGALPPARLALAMAGADVFVLPSRAEPLGVVLLEAMSCGTPCVASDVGGIPEIVEAGCGRLVPPDDVAALVDAIAHVLAAGKKAYRDECLRVAAAHDVNAVTKRFADVLADVIAEAAADALADTAQGGEAEDG